MKRHYFLMLALLLAFEGCSKNEVISGEPHEEIPEEPSFSDNFDPGFAAELQKRGYVADAKNITPEEVGGIVSLDVSECEEPLTSLRGIEYFEALRELDCSGNSIAVLDISNNTYLETLYCSYNWLLTSLDVSKNQELKKLTCNGNKLTSLNVSNNSKLEVLWCNENHLKLLDISNNQALKGISCAHNDLTSLDISNNKRLTELSCDGNKLNKLDTSNNPELIRLSCTFAYLDALDISHNAKLEYLYCYQNFGLKSLDISNIVNLKILRCFYCSLQSLDISNNHELEDLVCYGNPGDGTVFPVTAWFGNDAIPEDFTSGSWDYSGQTISIDYRKAN